MQVLPVFLFAQNEVAIKSLIESFDIPLLVDDGDTHRGSGHPRLFCDLQIIPLGRIDRFRERIREGDRLLR